MKVYIPFYAYRGLRLGYAPRTAYLTFEEALAWFLLPPVMRREGNLWSECEPVCNPCAHILAVEIEWADQEGVLALLDHPLSPLADPSW